MARMGPWGFWDALVLLSPIAFLVAMVLKPKPMPTAKSLWLAALILFVLKLWYLEAQPLEACACFIKGCLQALTPCSIVAGAIYLFDCMEAAQCLAWMKVQLRVITDGHPIAEVMLIGFCFAFVVEGASGFGTPAALAAPMLYSMGHPKLESVVCLLSFNTFMTIFGAVGTPVWFGIGEVVDIAVYGEENMRSIGFNAAVALGSCAILVVPFVVNIIVPFQVMKKSLVFIFLSTLSCVVPLVGLAAVNYEFPTLAAGIVGLCVTTCLTLCGIGLGEKPPRKEKDALEDVLKDSEKNLKEMISEHEEAVAEEKDIERGESQEIPLSQSKVDLWETCITGDEHPQAQDLDAPKPKESAKSVDALSEKTSTKSLRDRAVNSQVEVCTKTVNQFRKGRHLAILPRRIMEVLEGDRTPHTTARVDIDDAHAEHFNEGLRGNFDVIFRTMPLWLTVLLLILTRIEPIGLKDALRLKEPTIVDGQLGTLGHLSISAVFKISLTQILGTSIGWSYELLYIPFILPFVVAGSAALLVFRKELDRTPTEILGGVLHRIKGPAIALSGALILVELLRTGDASKDAPAVIIGTRLSETLSHGFVALSFLLGALGSFFSGSTTVSCLTFTQVQNVAAQQLGVSSNALIALQLCGASSGNAFCLSNIIAATAVIGLQMPEGVIVKRVLKPVFAQYIICTLVLLPFIYA